MNRLNKKELLTITGGFSFNLTGVIINAFVNAAKFIYEAGTSLGSSMRRISSGKLCSMK